MAEHSKIAWTSHTFNPWVGCQKWSKGCDNCYADAWAARAGRDVFGGRGKRERTSKSIWAKPAAWNHAAALDRRARMVFVASLADVFEDAPGPNEWRPDVWALIRACPWLDFQLLTKRPENIAGMLPEDWGRGWPNVWLGTSIEDRHVVHRARTLAAVPAFSRFVSYEPAIGPVFFDSGLRAGHDPGDRPLRNGRNLGWSDEGSGPALDLGGIHWLICGGESGPGHRPMDLDWARDAYNACQYAGTAFFFKQTSSARPGQGEDALGRVIRQMPASWDRAHVDVDPVYAPEGSLL